MAAISTIVAIAGLALATYSAVEASDQRREAKRTGERIQSESRADNAAKAAQERRQQIREERVRRARILQAGENTGTGGSSGEFGALGGLATALSSNIGSNLGSLQRANNISIFGQQQASAISNMQGAQDLYSLGGSIFGAAGGFSSIGAGYDRLTTPSPKTTGDFSRMDRGQT